MVDRLSNLAQFLEDESLPSWLKQELQKRRDEISTALEHGQSITITGPSGEKITIAPQASVAVA